MITWDEISAAFDSGFNCGFQQGRRRGKEEVLSMTTPAVIPGIRKVIVNFPATIIIWNDGTKSVVRCQTGDVFNIEHGIALCFMKKALGNSSAALNREMRECLERVENYDVNIHD